VAILQPGGRHGAGADGFERGQRELAGHREQLDLLALAVAQAAEACGHHVGDRWRQRPARRSLEPARARTLQRVADQLADEERVALGRRPQPVVEAACEAAARERLGQLYHLMAAEARDREHLDGPGADEVADDVGQRLAETRRGGDRREPEAHELRDGRRRQGIERRQVVDGDEQPGVGVLRREASEELGQ
jgi:hypothetical protein